jgi:hypothetical protein
MASRAARPRLLAAIVAASAAIFACRILASAFVGAPSTRIAPAQTALPITNDDSRRAAVLGFLGSVAAVASVKPAEAANIQPKISIFGLNINGGEQSDTYNSVDKDAYSSYSEFSGGNAKENIYQGYNAGEQESKLAELNECWRRYETDVKKQLDARIPNRVRMEMTRQVGRMRNNMQWYSDLPPRDLAKTKLAREFFEDVNGVLSFADRSRWEEADSFYAKSLNSLAKWKSAVGL